MKNVLFFFFLAAISSYSTADDGLPKAIASPLPLPPIPICPIGSNSHWVPCKRCEPRCTRVPFPCPLTTICIPGCICNSGYIRDLSGKCITMKKCENTCNCPKGKNCVCSPKVCVKAPCFQFDCV